LAIITLTTDFGTSDPFVGMMKGVILGIASAASIVDLCHEIPPQDILAGALALESAVEYFPVRSIHLAVVDPGVGTDRAPIAIETNGSILVGPDNGLFTLVLARSPLIRAVRLTNPQFHRSQVSATFHGRDIFAPVAAHLALGIPIAELGERIGEIRQLDIPRPIITKREMSATVLNIDHFGNLITNITIDELRAWMEERVLANVEVHAGIAKVTGINQTFADVAPGMPVAYIGSGGRLEIGVRNGNAASALQVARGAEISVHKR
jgi:S-adenosylmethionine hydrolase